MKCPKCSYENPPEVRYCFRCGAQLIPPVPKAQQKPVLKKAKVSPVLVILLCVFGFMAFLFAAFVFYSVIFWDLPDESAETAETIVSLQEEEQMQDALDHPVFTSDEDEQYFHQFINTRLRTLRLPDSEITVDLPNMSDFRFSYDPVSRVMMMEFKTPESMTVSITSTPADTPPYTKSEALENDASDLYQNIQGSETQYYYSLADRNAPSQSIYTGRIIDCKASRSTSIYVTGNGQEDQSGGQDVLNDLLYSTGLDQSSQDLKQE